VQKPKAKPTAKPPQLSKSAGKAVNQLVFSYHGISALFKTTFSLHISLSLSSPHTTHPPTHPPLPEQRKAVLLGKIDGENKTTEIASP
jgi:hypothetical protein